MRYNVVRKKRQTPGYLYQCPNKITHLTYSPKENDFPLEFGTGHVHISARAVLETVLKLYQNIPPASLINVHDIVNRVFRQICGRFILRQNAIVRDIYNRD